MRTWTWVNGSAICKGKGPSPRHSPQVVIVGNQLYVIGGGTGGDPPRSGEDLTDIHVLDLIHLDWREVHIGGMKPRLNRHNKCVAIGNKIVLIGTHPQLNESQSDTDSSSSNEEYLPFYRSSVCVLNTETQRWEWPKLDSLGREERGPKFPRYASAVTHGGNSVYLFGGCMNSVLSLSDTYQLRLDASLFANSELVEENHKQAIKQEDGRNPRPSFRRAELTRWLFLMAQHNMHFNIFGSE